MCYMSLFLSIFEECLQLFNEKPKSQSLSATESFVCNCFKMEGESCALTPVKPLDKQTFISYISLRLQILSYFFLPPNALLINRFI